MNNFIKVVGFFLKLNQVWDIYLGLTIAPDWIKIESTCRWSPWFTQFSTSDGDLVLSGSIRCLFQEHGGQVIEPLFQLQICSSLKFTNHTFLFVCWFVHLWYLIIDTCSPNLHILIPQSIHFNFLVVFWSNYIIICSKCQQQKYALFHWLFIDMHF